MSKNHYKRAIAIIDELIGAVEKRQKLDVGQNDWNHWSDLTRKLNDLCAKVNRWGRPTELPI
jgi:hypothetical protein